MLRFLVASLVLLLAGVFLFPWQTSAAELLSNGGFESGTDGWGWTFGQVDTVASPVHGGGSAARLESSALQAHEVYQFLDVQHDSAYEFSGWVLMNDADVQRVFLRVNWFDGEGSPVSATDSSWLTIPDAGYQRLSSGSVVSPSAARTARVEAWIQANGPFTVYLDDFSMAGAVQVPETATPAVTPAPTGPPVTPRPSANPTPRATRPPGADEETPPPEDAAPDPTVFDQLVNGGFEELAQDGSPYGWRDIGADIASLEGASAEGSRALQVVSLTSSTKWAYQTVRVEGGSVYEGGAYAMNTGGGELFLRISWYASDDGSGSIISSDDSTRAVLAGDAGFQQITTGAIDSPAEARTVKVKLMLRPDSSADTDGYFDAVTFGPSSGEPGGGPNGGPVGGGTAGQKTAAERAASGAATGASPAALAAAAGPTNLSNVKPVVGAKAAPLAASSGGRSWLPFLAAGIVLSAAGAGAGAVWWRKRRGEAGAGES